MQNEWIVVVGLLLTALGGTGTTYVALRRTKVENTVDSNKATLEAMTELNDRLTAENIRVNGQVDKLISQVERLEEKVAEIPGLKRRISELERREKTLMDELDNLTHE